jgi:hypothetical protein
MGEREDTAPNGISKAVPKRVKRGAASPKHVEFICVVMRLPERSAYSLSKGQKLHKNEAPCMMKVQLFFSRA